MEIFGLMLTACLSMSTRKNYRKHKANIKGKVFVHLDNSMYQFNTGKTASSIRLSIKTYWKQ